MNDPWDQSLACQHYWDIDRTNKGTCKLCDEERQFPLDGMGEVVVLKEGRKVARQVATAIPSKYTLEEKARILEESDVQGVPAVCEKYGIPHSTLYSWRTRRHRRELKTQIATSKPADELEGLPHDLWLRRDGDVVQLYCHGKLWAAFSVSDGLQRELTHRTIMELVERYLREGTLGPSGSRQ